MSRISDREKAIIIVCELLLIAGVIWFGSQLIIHAQTPASPSQPQAASGTITALVNGVPIATGGTINLKSGTGVIASASPDPSIDGTDISFAAESAVMLERSADQAGIDRAIVATSSGAGLKYTASTLPALANYTSGQVFVLTPDVPNQANATLDLGPGPIAIQGTCSQICLLLASGNPVNAFVVH